MYNVHVLTVYNYNIILYNIRFIYIYRSIYTCIFNIYYVNYCILILLMNLYMYMYMYMYVTCITCIYTQYMHSMPYMYIIIIIINSYRCMHEVHTTRNTIVHVPKPASRTAIRKSFYDHDVSSHEPSRLTPHFKRSEPRVPLQVVTILIGSKH